MNVVEQLPYDHIFRNPNYKEERLTVKDSTDKSSPFFVCCLLQVFEGKSWLSKLPFPKSGTKQVTRYLSQYK